MRTEIVKWGLILAYLVASSVGDTRFECIASLGGNDGFGGDNFGGDGFGGDVGEGFGFGDADEFEGFGDSENEGFGGMMGIQTAVGSLMCPKGNRGSILVKRVTYGVGAFPGTCQPTPFCGLQHDAGESVAQKCDGKSTCSVNILQPKMMGCGQLSNYIHVEYECVDTWATYEICETITTVAKSASVIVTSPGYLGTSSLKTGGTQMCECIIQSHDKADIYMDYLQTQLASDGSQCPYEFVLIESKKNLTQAKNDREMEVCGNRHVSGQWFEGSLRITYASGGSLEKRGLLAKFTVDNVGNAPMIELECGKVSAKNLNLQKRPPLKQKSPSRSLIPSGMPGMPGLPMGMPTFPTMPTFSGGAISGGPGNMLSNLFAPSPTSSNSNPDFSKWKINLGNNKGTANEKPGTVKVRLPSQVLQNPASSSVQAKAPTKPIASIQRPDRGQKPAGRKPTRNSRPRQPAGKKPGARKVVSDGDEAVMEETVSEKTKSGGSLALILSAVGAVLILGSVGILAIHNYRKRQRIKKEEARYASGGTLSCTYGKGWKADDVEEESVYATVAEVDAYREGCVNPAVTATDEFACRNRETADVSVECKLSTCGSHGNDDDKYDRLSLSKEVSESSNRNIKSNQQTIQKYSSESTANNVKQATKSGKQTTKSAKQTTKHVTVIDVHRSFKDSESEISSEGSPVLHTSGCLDDCMYATATPSVNRCSECNISRPPRKRDSERRGYDNNLSVKYKYRTEKDQ